MPAIASCSATWLPPEPQPAMRTRVSLRRPTSNSGAMRAKSAASSLICQSFRLRPVTCMLPCVVMTKPFLGERERGKDRVLSGIPAAHDAVEAKSAVAPAVRRAFSDRTGIHSGAAVRISVGQEDRQLNRGVIAELERKADCQFAGFCNCGARLLAMLLQLFEFISDPGGGDVRKENGEGDETCLAMAVAFDDEGFAALRHPVKDFTGAGPQLRH